MKFGTRKIESWGCQVMKKLIMTLGFFVSTQYRLMTDGRTDRQRDRHVAVAKTRASIASRG